MRMKYFQSGGLLEKEDETYDDFNRNQTISSFEKNIMNNSLIPQELKLDLEKLGRSNGIQKFASQ